ncbi:tetratricopeptide repeat protein [Yoonia sp. R2331]|uniref:tetratricopeptide repeat protein n=1 Tax=Yoonia sp. R2331 TaxID=3237238 RepID=UPI0034E3B1D9
MQQCRAIIAMALILTLAACSTGGFGASNDAVGAPGVAGTSDVDGLIVGHRLMAAGEYELALRAYTRAAAQQGLNVDTMSALGSANLKLGRLGQAERLLRRATEEAPDFPAAWNNLGVILLEKREYAEAVEVFRRAFATDNGNSDQIRQNLALALAKLEDPFYVDPQQNQGPKLVRRGTGDFVILTDL